MPVPDPTWDSDEEDGPADLERTPLMTPGRMSAPQRRINGGHAAVMADASPPGRFSESESPESPLGAVQRVLTFQTPSPVPTHPAPFPRVPLAEGREDLRTPLRNPGREHDQRAGPDQERGEGLCAAARAVADPPGHLPQPAGDVQDLLDAYQGVIPAECREDLRRWESVLAVLREMQVSPQELKALVQRGKDRDWWRAIVASELVYALSFCAANALPLVLPKIGSMVGEHFGESAAERVPAPVSSGAFVLASLIIAFGAEGAQAIIRKGAMGARYNVATMQAADGPVRYDLSAAGQRVQAISAWPFAAAYAAEDLARDQAHTAPAWRLVAGAGAAAVSAAFRMRCAATHAMAIDPAWLDASTEEKKADMRSAIEDLRKNPVVAIGGYLANNVAPGLVASPREAFSPVGWAQAASRVLSASLARAGAAVMIATGTSQSLVGKLLSDAWLGLSWGSLSTWPQRVVEGAANQLAQRTNAPVAPPPSLHAVAPVARPVPDPALSPFSV